MQFIKFHKFSFMLCRDSCKKDLDLLRFFLAGTGGSAAGAGWIEF